MSEEKVSPFSGMSQVEIKRELRRTAIAELRNKIVEITLQVDEMGAIGDETDARKQALRTKWFATQNQALAELTLKLEAHEALSDWEEDGGALDAMERSQREAACTGLMVEIASIELRIEEKEAIGVQEDAELEAGREEFIRVAKDNLELTRLKLEMHEAALAQK